MTTPNSLARTAGVLYLLMVIAGAFGVIVFAAVVEPGDAAATADNIRASAGLFRAGFLSYLLGGPCFVLAGIVLYGLLKHVDRLAAIAMVTLNAIGTATACLSLLNWYTAIAVATGDTYPRTFGEAGADALTLHYLDMYDTGVGIAFVFDSLWLVPLGYLMIRSGYFPKALGVALIVGCAGYLVNDVFIAFLATEAASTTGIGLLLTAVAGLSEIAFVAWLLAKGVRTPTPARGPAVAAATAS
ncbi:DUF4386 domain-containing protein [Phytohabitans sp. ZYX-F-186]|uniref:DUF4386 domain-containing protein n=1 Tax=Phytohabitans maris TaxID=3071409 RepID=A0ABU0ZMP4_9ACTN|nr:DUF4386 domain-containing protein [Phytohabitans sp. ZYX-F-186]MDQ7908307.1 DUF4386 domain-containing protein [Phytohabitans sp. ZYX-F-186]